MLLRSKIRFTKTIILIFRSGCASYNINSFPFAFIIRSFPTGGVGWIMGPLEFRRSVPNENVGRCQCFTAQPCTGFLLDDQSQSTHNRTALHCNEGQTTVVEHSEFLNGVKINNASSNAAEEVVALHFMQN